MGDKLEFPALEKYGEHLKHNAKVILGDMEGNLSKIAVLREQARERKEAYTGIRDGFLEEIHSNIPEGYKGKSRESSHQSGQLGVIENPDVYDSPIIAQGRQEQTQNQIQTEAPQDGVDYTAWGLNIGGTLAIATLGIAAVKYRQRNRTPAPAVRTGPIEPDRR